MIETETANQIADVAFPRTGSIDHPAASLAECRAQLDLLADGITPSRVQRVVGTVFHDLLRLLECLSIIESHLRHVDTAEESFAFFKMIHDEARSLIEFIRADALNCESASGELADALDGITFALSHDLRRVFEGENELVVDKTPYVVLSRVHRAHDVLTNCLQQSTITLAMVFDRSLVGAKLFRNCDKRHRESLKLCAELNSLRQLVDDVNQDQSPATATFLTKGLETFRNETLQFLMYSDWPQFESFSARIQFSLSADTTALGRVLHEFQCYLDTLLRQVKMRAVLADQPAHSFETVNQETESGQDKLIFTRDDVPAWGEFAFAV